MLEGLFYLRNEYRLIRKGCTHRDKEGITLDGNILYVPSDTGFTQKQTHKELHYFGLVSKIPLQGYPYNIRSHDINIADLFTVVNDNGDNLIPFKNGIIERYEIQDINSYDVHVMYRVPYVYL